MTGIGMNILGLLAAGAIAGGGAIATDSVGSGDGTPRTALVIDAATGRDGRELVDPRLDAADAEVRLPRTLAEARTNVRYFDAQGYRLVVAGPRATAAAAATGAEALRTPDLTEALAAVEGP